MDSSLRFAFITFNPHPGNPSHLTEFLTLFSPLINKAQYSASIIEEYGTPNAHYHAIVSGKWRDSDKMNSWFWNVKMKKFGESLKYQHTLKPVAFKNILIKQKPDDSDYWFTEDIETCLGYVLKTDCEKSRETIQIKGFTNEQILQADKMYFTSQKLKNRNDVLKNDWTLLTKKNAHCLIEDYCKKNNQTIRDSNLIKNMKRSRYSFVDLTSKAQKEIFDEIMISENKLDEDEEAKIDSEIKCKIYDGKYAKEDIFDASHETWIIEQYREKLLALEHKYNDLYRVHYEGTKATFRHALIED